MKILKINLTIYRINILILLVVLPCLIASKPGHKSNIPYAAGIEGRWDLTMYSEGKQYPSWLEVRHSGLHTLVGQFVGPGGSARPISKVNFNDNRMSFSIPPQWEPGTVDLHFDAIFEGDSLRGTMVSSDGKKFSWSGVRAPSLWRTKEPEWDSTITLFNGKDLSGWHPTGVNQWKALGGNLVSPKSGSNIITDRTFTDFKLHIEFMYPKGSNSGVYLRGRYEVQIADSKGLEPLKDQLGAIYGFVAPNEMMAKDAGEWQSYDITLIGRLVSIMVNGKQVICSQEIPGITGGALDSHEGEPGPLLIQGDHGPIEFRNIQLTPAK
jgi:Domain of Unknown Function (DUF1080)